MTQAIELWVDRSDIRTTKAVEHAMPALADGHVRVAIDQFALTANNVSYAVSGDAIGYWGFFPATDNWGKVPVWGSAEVVESNCAEVPLGERLWGFLPMASHVDLLPGRIRDDQFADVSAHRQTLPVLYNNYRRTNAEPDYLQEIEVERSLLFPLFVTSFVLYDFLVDNDFFGAEQVVIGSVSSKTGFGLAQLLHDDAAVSQRVVGVTSPANVGFVEGLGCCDEVIVYGAEGSLDAASPAAYVDMSGDGKLTQALHDHFGANLVESCAVGGTHWDASRSDASKLPGAKPHFFFAPSQIGKREKDWGAGVAMARANEASAHLAHAVRDDLTIAWTHDIGALQTLWTDMLGNKISGRAGQMVSLTRKPV